MEDVVRVTYPAPAVAQVTMEDRANRNTFSRGLVTGLLSAFARLGADQGLKAVVLCGHDSIFCAGGTQEELLEIARGTRSFDAGGFYRLLLDFPVPVIAAMQGHALGGGLVFGLYADLVVLAEESIYAANFMKYGFTPGMGATHLLPEKMGPALAAEMLLTANAYHGGTLRERGIPFPVVKRAQVAPFALQLARDLADKPALSLRLLKRALTERISEGVQAAVEREKEMHAQTFSQPGVQERIQERFGS